MSWAGRETMVVGVCTYNRGREIVRTLRAIDGMNPVIGADGRSRLRQVVVIDNGSTDGTGEIVREFARAGTRIPLELVGEPRPGKTAAMQKLFAATDELVVCIIDDDTLPAEAWAEAMLSLFDEKPRAGIVGGPVRNLWESGPTKLARIYHRSLGDQLLGGDRVQLTEPMSFLMGASLAIRRRAIEDSGWLSGSQLASRTGDSLECGAEDAELCIRVRQAGWELWYEPRAAMEHLIPARRQTVEYLARLRGAICRGEPALRWVAGLVPSAEVARREAARARARYRKTLLFDWRPTRRRIRLAERRGRVEGWERLVEMLEGDGGRATRADGVS